MPKREYTLEDMAAQEDPWRGHGRGALELAREIWPKLYQHYSERRKQAKDELRSLRERDQRERSWPEGGRLTLYRLTAHGQSYWVDDCFPVHRLVGDPFPVPLHEFRVLGDGPVRAIYIQGPYVVEVHQYTRTEDLPMDLVDRVEYSSFVAGVADDVARACVQADIGWAAFLSALGGAMGVPSDILDEVLYGETVRLESALYPKRWVRELITEG